MGELIPFEENSVPSHLRNDKSNAGDLSGGISSGYPIFSIKGKRWALSQDGNRKVIMSPNDPDSPAAYVDLVIVKTNPNLSKVYYKGGYTEGSDAKPDCYSNDGLYPAADVDSPPSKKCATCPMNIWGSKVTDNGSKTKACSDSRRMAVATAGRPDKPMLLRIPAASLKPLAAVARQIEDRGIDYRGVIVRMMFDDSVAHPQLVFKPIGLLDEDTFDKVKACSETSIVKDIVGLAKITEVSNDSRDDDRPTTKLKSEVLDETQLEEVVAKPSPKKRVEKVAEVTDALSSVLDGFDD